MIHFKYQDLVDRAKDRPKGYLQEILRSARVIGSDVVMSEDAYAVFRMKYGRYDEMKMAVPLVKKLMAHRLRLPITIQSNWKRGTVLAPNGKPLASGCCGGQSTKILQTA